MMCARLYAMAHKNISAGNFRNDNIIERLWFFMVYLYLSFLSYIGIAFTNCEHILHVEFARATFT